MPSFLIMFRPSVHRGEWANAGQLAITDHAWKLYLQFLNLVVYIDLVIVQKAGCM
jgi:hypothetical protein